MGKKSDKHAAPVEDAEEDVPAVEEQTLTYEDKLEFVHTIAQPMLSRKQAKKLYKIAKKGRENKSVVMGLKAVKKAITNGSKGIMVLAGDSDPIDIISHFPVLCEDNKVPYCWVPSKKDLGSAVKGRALCAMIVNPNESYQDLFNACYEAVKGLPMPVTA